MHSASSRLVVVCKAQALKLQMLKLHGLDSNIIYKAQISLFTCHLETDAVNRVVAAVVDALVSAFVSMFGLFVVWCMLLH